MPPRSSHSAIRAEDTLAHRELLERRRQVRGLLWIALAVLAFSIARAVLNHVFPSGWWRLW